jgi:hypothetical protein
MFLETITLGHVLAPIISASTVVLLYHYLGRDYLGAAENEYWNTLRIGLLSTGDSTIRQKTNFALTNAATKDEFVVTLDKTPQETAQLFEDAGYLQCVISGLKYRPPDVDPNTSSQVEFESGSMVYRESGSSLLADALAKRQVHVYWFDNGDGSVDLYAHEEYSSLNPLFAWKHYRAKTQNPALGKERALAVIRDE